MNNVVLVFALR